MDLVALRADGLEVRRVQLLLRRLCLVLRAAALLNNEHTVYVLVVEFAPKRTVCLAGYAYTSHNARYAC